MIPNFFLKIDLYGIPYSFTVFNELLYKTATGGTMTILTILLNALIGRTQHLLVKHQSQRIIKNLIYLKMIY